MNPSNTRSDHLGTLRLAALLAGVVWIVSGIFALKYKGEHEPRTLEDYLVEGTFVAGVVLTALTLLALQRVQAGRSGALGKAGLWIFLVASAGQVIGAATQLMGSDALQALVFPVGLLGVLIGLILLGAATIRARVFARWVGVGLIVGLPVAIGLPGGNIVFGIFWLLLALFGTRTVST